MCNAGKDILVVEISGKRPGSAKQRPTENLKIAYDHLIISNDCNGYRSDWQIVNVPDSYKEWYCARYKTSDNAWYAPMNRSYAIKYAREHGYKYLVQLDDNIKQLEIKIYDNDYAENITRRLYIRNTNTGGNLINDFIRMFACVLENTDAGMVGCNLMGASVPEARYLAERYVYSIFMLDLERCPDCFQGDFEDDIEFRLKMKQIGVPVVQIVPFRYSKTSQHSGSKDETGCRKAYTDAGVKRGEHMRTLYGKEYSCGTVSKTASTTSVKAAGKQYFQHKLTRWKVGVKVEDQQKIDAVFREIILSNYCHYKDSYKTFTKKRKS